MPRIDNEIRVSQSVLDRLIDYEPRQSQEAPKSRLVILRELKQAVRRDLEWLTSCDVLVAEASGSSYGVGFEVGYVLGRAPQTGQHVVLVYDRGRRQAISRLITGNDDASCRTFEYASIDDLAAFLDEQFATPAGQPR